MKIKTAALTGAALDWAVAKCEGALAPLGNVQLVESKRLLICVGNDPDHGGSRVYFAPSIDWSQGGPIIERERINTIWLDKTQPDAMAPHPTCCGANIDSVYQSYGPTPLIAAMRCYVASKLGSEIDIPKELLE